MTLGNMWAQTWDGIWDIVKPEEFGIASSRRKEIFANMTVVQMVERCIWNGQI